MNGAVRVLRQEVRRLLPLVLAMGVVTAVLVWTHPSDWGTRWNSLGAYLRETTIVLGPACVVVGVWCGGSGRRAATGELLSSTRRSALGRVTVDLVALTIVLYLGVLLGWASGAWTIPVIGGWGTWVAVWYLVGLLPVVVAYTAVGYALGRTVPWRVAAPLAGITTYVVFGLGVYRDSRLEEAFGAGRLGGTDGYVVLGDVLLWCSLGLLLVGVAATGLAAAERRPAAVRGWVVLVVVAAAAAILPFGRIAAQPGERSPSVVARAPVVCSKDRGPRVCVLREQQHALVLATRQARAAIARFGGVPGAPTRAAPYVGGTLPRGTLGLENTGITPWGHPGGGNYATELVNASSYLDPYAHCAAARKSARNRLTDAAGASGAGIAGLWLSHQMYMVDSSGPVIERRFVAASTAERQRFAGRLALAAEACDPEALLAAADALPELSGS